MLTQQQQTPELIPELDKKEKTKKVTSSRQNRLRSAGTDFISSYVTTQCYDVPLILLVGIIVGCSRAQPPKKTHRDEKKLKSGQKMNEITVGDF